jgi:XTP/dITP diphosphohydrolase
MDATDKVLGRGAAIVVASHNSHKLAELSAFLEPFGLIVRSSADLGVPEPEETGETFAENAAIKAIAAATAVKLPALADDSGLEVAALNGEPGVRSARWAGAAKDFAGAMRRVEDGLAAAGARSPEERKARFVSVIALAWPDGTVESYEGTVHGHLVWPPRGRKGFGYDPVFLPEGETRTFGEMDQSEKDRISHRARAFTAFANSKLVGF